MAAAADGHMRRWSRRLSRVCGTVWVTLHWAAGFRSRPRPQIGRLSSRRTSGFHWASPFGRLRKERIAGNEAPARKSPQCAVRTRVMPGQNGGESM